MSRNKFSDLQTFFQTDQEMFKEKRKDFLIQIQTETIQWEDESVAFARQMQEDGFLDNDFLLTVNAKRLLGLMK